MTDSKTQVEHLLNSVLGCAFLVALDENGLTPDDAADPNTSLRLAAACADSVDKYGPDYESVAPGVLALASEKAALARALIEHPGTAWWFEPVDLNRQTWLSIHGTPDKFIYGTPPNTDEWRSPKNPSARWECYAQKPLSNQHTSTLYGPRLTSQLIAYDARVGDYYCMFPLAWWAMRFPQDARVFEVNSPSDWHELCVRYQARGTEDDRLVPNWGAVSEEWDGVHLSLGGLLTTEQGRYESPAGWTMLESWHAEQTYWLRSLEIDTERLPDFNPDPSDDPRGFAFPDFPGAGTSAGLLRARKTLKVAWPFHRPRIVS